MDNWKSYNLSLDHLSLARDKQAMISKLELENNLLRINAKYDFIQLSANNMAISRNIAAIESLTASRNESLINAIDVALKVLHDDLNRDPVLFLSSGNMMLDSILSFIDAYKIKLVIPIHTYLQASNMHSSLILKGLQYFNIQQNLFRICNL